MNTKYLSISLALLFAFTISMDGCAQSKAPEAKEPSVQSKEKKEVNNIPAGKVETQVSSVEATEILNKYLPLKDALVATDGPKASIEAAALLSVLGDHDDKLIEKIKFDAEHISDTKDAGHQRDHFNSLSNNIYKLLKASNTTGSKVYRQFCPMAQDGKGAYWLSAESEISNPYYGDKMLRCGTTKEEL